MEFKQQASTLLNGGINVQKTFFNENQHEFLHEMVAYIGAEDKALRDDLNYRLFIDLIQYDVLSQEQKHIVLYDIQQQNLLLHKIGEENTSSVYTRALTAEWLRLLLSPEQMQGDIGKEILNNTLLLLDRERDLRSFTENGFAYSIGNSSLLINILLKERHDTVNYAPSVLTAIQSNFWKENVFTDDEEERLISLIEVLLSKEVEEDIIVEWIEQVFDRLEMTVESQGYSTYFLKARTQILQFMKSLYFVLKFKNDYKKIQSVVSIFIQKWYRI